MKKLSILFLILFSYVAYPQKKTFFEIQLSVLKSLPTADFTQTHQSEINSGQITPAISFLLYRQIFRPNIYFTTGLSFSHKNARFQLNIDTLSYSGRIYTQPKYRTISIPVLIGIQKKVDINFNPVAERKRTIGVAAGISVDFVKESRFKEGMSLQGKGFSFRTRYKTVYMFRSNTGISFNLMFALPLFTVGKHKSVFLTGTYKYPFYLQHDLNIIYEINNATQNYEVNRLRLQELNLGLSFRFSD